MATTTTPNLNVQGGTSFQFYTGLGEFVEGTNKFGGLARPLYEGREGSAFTADGHRDYTQVYEVMVNFKTTSKDDVCKCPGIPKPWTKYVPFSLGLIADSQALCVDISAKPKDKDDTRFWLVTCKYSTRVPAHGPPRLPAFTGLGDELTGTQNEPWKERPRIEWEEETINEAFAKDLDGKAFLDTAGQPFNPPPVTRVSCPVLMVYKNEQFHDPKLSSRYAYAINSDTFAGFEPKKAQCYPIKARGVWRGGQFYYEKTYKFVFLPDIITGQTGRERTWQGSILSKGLYRRATADDAPDSIDVPLYIFLSRGGRATTPQLLDINGQPTKIPYYIPFKIYQELPFSTIISADELTNIGVFP